VSPAPASLRDRDLTARLAPEIRTGGNMRRWMLAGGLVVIIACGGDGTVSEVANGILSSGKDVELGILPSGTGGDFRRTLDIPSRSRDAARVLRNGRTVRIDVGRVSFIDNNGAEAMRYFVGVASCGMSTRVIERVKADGISFASSLAIV